MECFCKNGLPSGDLYEYSAYVIQNYEKKWKKIKAGEVKDKINEYKKEKEIEREKEKELKEQREAGKYITI